MARSRNDLLLDSTKPLPEPLLNYLQSMDNCKLYQRAIENAQELIS